MILLYHQTPFLSNLHFLSEARGYIIEYTVKLERNWKISVSENVFHVQKKLCFTLQIILPVLSAVCSWTKGTWMSCTENKLWSVTYLSPIYSILQYNKYAHILIPKVHFESSWNFFILNKHVLDWKPQSFKPGFSPCDSTVGNILIKQFINILGRLQILNYWILQLRNLVKNPPK